MWRSKCGTNGPETASWEQVIKIPPFSIPKPLTDFKGTQYIGYGMVITLGRRMRNKLVESLLSITNSFLHLRSQWWRGRYLRPSTQKSLIGWMLLCLEILMPIRWRRPSSRCIPLFHQHLWPMVKSIVITIALDFLNHGIALPHFHDTHIALIPKTKNPKSVTDYRPISLCNVTYKLASKVVANIMKIVL